MTYNSKDAQCAFCKRPYVEREFAVGRALEEPVFICCECIEALNTRFKKLHSELD